MNYNAKKRSKKTLNDKTQKKKSTINVVKLTMALLQSVPVIDNNMFCHFSLPNYPV